LIAALMNGPILLKNARELPASFEKTKAQFQSWVYEDAEWTGIWTSFPEGLIDMEALHLSDVDLEITIWAKQGHIDGVIATTAICRQFPMWDYVLLRGDVSGNDADVVAYDFILGYARDFARLRLTREGNVITVTPLDGRKDWFPDVARLGRSPLAPTEEPDPDMSYCEEHLRPNAVQSQNATGAPSQSK
jgi:hypothetical protein